MISWFRRKKQRPNAASVMKRVIILRHLFVKGLATPPLDLLDPIRSKWTNEERLSFEDHARSLSAIQARKLRAGGLWGEMGQSERNFIEASPGQMRQQDRINASWLGESAVCLLWSLKQVQQVPLYDERAGEDIMKGQPGETVNDLLKDAILRSASEIDRQRGLAELWHWRCRTRQLIESKQMPAQIAEGLTIEDVIRETAKLAGSKFDLSPIEDDFPIFGRPFRDATEEEYSIVRSIAYERHKAFNWLCGFAPGNRWSKIPTNT